MKQIEKEFIIAMLMENVEPEKVINVCNNLKLNFNMVDLAEALFDYIKVTKK